MLHAGCRAGMCRGSGRLGMGRLGCRGAYALPWQDKAPEDGGDPGDGDGGRERSRAFGVGWTGGGSCASVDGVLARMNVVCRDACEPRGCMRVLVGACGSSPDCCMTSGRCRSASDAIGALGARLVTLSGRARRVEQ